MRDLFGCGSPVGSISTMLADKRGKEWCPDRKTTISSKG
jgi:hypothetical protein